MHYYFDVWKNYANVKGRATRKQYWMFVLINSLVGIVIGMIEGMLGMEEDFVGSLYTLAVLCPSICLGVRRLHDVNKRGWWYALLLVPFVQFYVIYLIWAKRGTAGVNDFGAPVGSVQEPVYGAYSVPVENEFSGYEMCPAPQLSKPEKAKCAYCGMELETGAKFCGECGAPVEK